jgi:hypothetical protein
MNYRIETQPSEARPLGYGKMDTNKKAEPMRAPLHEVGAESMNYLQRVC